MAEKSTNLEKSVIHEVINALLDHLRKDYVFPDVANEAVRYIEKRLIDGDYYSCVSCESFSLALTEDLFEISKDKQLKRG